MRSQQMVAVASVAEDAPDSAGAAASAVLAWATGVGHDPVAVDLDRESHFQFHRDPAT